MLNKKIEQKLIAQFNYEWFASNLYLAMSAYLLRNGWTGFAHFFRVQADEERTHAMKIFDYVHRTGGTMEIFKTDAPQKDFKSLKDIFQISLKSEKQVSEAIYELVDLAHKEKDYATHSFMDWFVKEQMEEENLMNGMLYKLERFGDDKAAMYLLDKEAGERKAES